MKRNILYISSLLLIALHFTSAFTIDNVVEFVGECPTSSNFTQTSEKCIDNWYRTETPATWYGLCGDEHGENACFIEKYWDEHFEKGLVVGCPPNRGKFAGFTEPRYLLPLFAIKYFEPIFVCEIAALTLSLHFDYATDSFSRGCSRLQDLRVCEPNYCKDFKNWTILQIWEQANDAVGDCCEPREDPVCNPESLYQCVIYLNRAFSGGRYLQLLDGNIREDSCQS